MLTIKPTIKSESVSANGKFKIMIIPLTLLIIGQTSCKKLVDIPPPTNSIAENGVFTNNTTAIAVLTGLYASFNGQPIQGNMSISLLAGLSADELSLYSGVSSSVSIAYYQNALAAVSQSIIAGSEHWELLYRHVYKCNAAIEGLNASTNLTSAVKQQLLGEAKFLRAYFYFYLVNLFGDVPLVLNTDPQENTLLARSVKSKVYQQIIADLVEAQTLLSNGYLDGTLLNNTVERVRPTRWAATALLARVYLYYGNLTNDATNYTNAETQTTAVINNSSLYNLTPLNNCFLKNSMEAIWQVQPTDIDFNTPEAKSLIIPSTGLSDDNPVSLSNQLLNSFEAGDQRLIDGNWINSITVSGNTYRYPFKYKINTTPGVTTAADMTEYFMVLRLGEQYLIRAEARAQQNNIGGAQSDLNAIRTRAGLVNTIANDRTSLLSAILHERQIELFSEWGHRWFDLKRTNNVDSVMTLVTPQKANGTPWRSFQQLYPLSITELQKAPNLVQNQGY